MKSSFFGKACIAMLFCFVQLGGIYANNGGTPAAAPAPKQSKFSVMTTLTKLHNLQNTKKSVLADNSSVTNFLPNGTSLYMAYLEITHGNGQTEFVVIYPASFETVNGQTTTFNMPNLTNIIKISLGHLSGGFDCSEYGTITIGGSDYIGYSDCMNRIEWDDISEITSGITLKVY